MNPARVPARIAIALILFTCAALHARPVPAEESKSAQRPNVVVLMADDMGYSDIGCYGGEIRTPHIDRLAEGGLRFTQFYNTGRCCPTRASLLTGLYPHQTGVGHMTSDRDLPGYRGNLNDRCVTMAEVLRKAGYGTYMSGKWHLTRYTAPQGPKDNWPRQRGFDRFFGTINGAGSFFAPDTLTLDNEQIAPPGKKFYYTSEISDYAATFIREHQSKRPDDPLFLYVAYTAPHWPLHALEPDIARYRRSYQQGWDALREQRYARMLKLGVIDSRWDLTPRDEEVQPWDALDPETQKTMAMKMAVYAAQIDSMDQGIGRVLQALEETGRLENTLIFFLADNGGCAEGGSLGFDRKKGAGTMLGQDSSFASYGTGWANVSNTPFRRYKHYVHEGGIATPLVVHWPQGIHDPGQLRRQPAHLVDLMATVVEVTGANYPTRSRGRDITQLEGTSLVPAFADQPLTRQAIFWEHEGNRAVRVDQWKLVAKGVNGPWELYDLEADRTETNDLASRDTIRVQQMAALWQQWAQRCDVLPMRGQKPQKQPPPPQQPAEKEQPAQPATDQSAARVP